MCHWSDERISIYLLLTAILFWFPFSLVYLLAWILALPPRLLAVIQNGIFFFFSVKQWRRLNHPCPCTAASTVTRKLWLCRHTHIYIPAPLQTKRELPLLCCLLTLTSGKSGSCCDWGNSACWWWITRCKKTIASSPDSGRKRKTPSMYLHHIVCIYILGLYDIKRSQLYTYHHHLWTYVRTTICLLYVLDPATRERAWYRAVINN